ncbi:helix-turn-helix transcriptional regulator [Enterocloster bolteae]|uniref:helix-turn-helix domain-containing protein n=1 Tax=Enterocloster bolteae TaxID=208479 RepID=UPI000E4E5667|nr:helix-turn-helix transcriptional regulator [Enterocloster bolteae]MBT9827053.1 helix-turn-helix domain-containing protein [Enterocloster bolteae]QJU21189.1 helix-turn-helix transcriptional regulator [Enterocloster bolteae]RGS06835.1 XRE family transcriptional regulator [Enterocloster bolteae]DAG82132.1 MAG TPA: helix-turn-helix domain protein [Caudoviricetes sp.]
MNTYERIRFLRKEILHKTQEEFAESIRISRSNLGNIETGKVAVTNRVISDICVSFHVNETWLLTGEGGDDNIFTQISADDRFSLNLGKLSTTENEFVRNGINLLAETDPEKLKILEDFMKAWLGIK